MESEDLYAFLSDPNLVELIEQNKVTDDFFDVFDLTENQHSNLLAWCMNPNEGHSQGDAVIKDFLEAGYAVSSGTIWDNKKFFAKWTPGKIRTSSFGAAFVTRELSIEVERGGKKGRLDLFLMDPQNKILVTIENKAGASLTAEQLEKYVQAVKAEVSSNKVFADYDLAFVVLDRDLKDYSQPQLDALGKRWTLLDYNWLEASAKRARFQLARDKNAAQLLVAYCQRQTEWESPAEKRTSELAADLAIAHPSVIEALRGLRRQSVLDWRLKTLEGAGGELTLFDAQHRLVCEKLVGIRGVATIVQQLRKIMPELKQEQIESGRIWVSVVPTDALALMRDREDGYWPMYLTLRQASKVSRPDAPKFNLNLLWARGEFSASVCDEPALREHFDKDFPGLKHFANSDYRRITIAEHLDPAEAVKTTKATLDTMNAAIRSYSR
ncbi:PD-(D/E)XK nuclease family protein [Burkholderia plantarii]|uniref:PD-(D/E)XK nuclease superfamily protein n=1 Tax=Burkholderia plantarii TaxID=41899 RepID=A0A0B6S0L3_BURPL|nr:PD-(D/E)XK nuclease family protein [Burkholderia plantarii]AJK46835.1 hypothetical protein BGL_1c23310 [Burkholderia plantarii]